MKSWIADDIYKPIQTNVVFYDGPSMLNGGRILAVASAQNGNRKIGHMLQLWIMPAISPIEAVRTGRDVLRLMVWARESGKFQVDGGWVSMCDWWDRNVGFDEWPWFLQQLKDANGGVASASIPDDQSVIE